MNHTLNPILLAVIAVVVVVSGFFLVSPSAQTPQPQTNQVYIVQKGDDLGKVAKMFYGSDELAPAIVWFSTIKADEDPAFAINTQDNNLREGQKLWIPSIEEVFSAQAKISATARTRSDLMELSITEIQRMMDAGQLTSHQLVAAYIERIQALDRTGPLLDSIIELNPDALAIADALDAERKASGPRGPLHGIPILLKDNIDTADKLETTAGSYALTGTVPGQDAFVVEGLRKAGAVILGKANLSEWANYRDNASISGWSARGGLTRNPYRLDSTPWGSSSGSGVAVTSNLVTVALGTETAGSITAPSVINGIVGIKPTIGLTSRAGVVPIAHSFDTVGPMARSLTDAVIVLGAITGVDPRDPMTSNSAGKFYTDYTQFLDPNGLKGARLGIVRPLIGDMPPDVERLFNKAIALMKAAGAEIVEIKDMPHLQEVFDYNDKTVGITPVLSYEFNGDIAAYLSTRVPSPNVKLSRIPRTMDDLIALNKELSAQELKFFGQDLFEDTAAHGKITDAKYQEALATYRRWTGAEGIETVMKDNNLTVLVMPTNESLARIYAALAGYPIVTVPGGFTDNGLPWGLGFVGTAYSEPSLIRVAYPYEQLSQERRPPKFLLTLNRKNR